MRRNWQPINQNNFEANFAIFQPNLHLKAHSYLSAAGRLHLLSCSKIERRMLLKEYLLNCYMFSWQVVQLDFVQLLLVELSTC